jgi:hypothetical protein
MERMRQRLDELSTRIYIITANTRCITLQQQAETVVKALQDALMRINPNRRVETDCEMINDLTGEQLVSFYETKVPAAWRFAPDFRGPINDMYSSTKAIKSSRDNLNIFAPGEKWCFLASTASKQELDRR